MIMITVLTETTEFDVIEGIESLVYWVDNREDIDSWDTSHDTKFWDKDLAYEFAHKLSRKTRTEDVVENWA